MAWKREVVGSFLKSKDDSKPPYIKFKKPLSLKEGDMIRVESKKFQLNSLQSAISSGKIKAENAEKMLARVQDIPDFVLGDLVVLSKED